MKSSAQGHNTASARTCNPAPAAAQSLAFGRREVRQVEAGRKREERGLEAQASIGHRDKTSRGHEKQGRVPVNHAQIP